MNENEYQEAILAKIRQADKALSVLPHPVRLKAMSDISGAVVNDEHERAVAVWSGLCQSLEMGVFAASLLGDSTVDMHEFLRIMTETSRTFHNLVIEMSHAGSNANFGNVEAVVMESRLRLLDWAVFQTRDTLEQRLALTDIGADMPCKFFRLPFDRVYLECGETRSSPLIVHNAQSGEHVFEGAYLEQFTREICGKPVRVIYLMLMGSPLGKEHCADDAYYTLTITLDDEDESLETALERVFDHTQSTVKQNSLALPSGHFKNFAEKDRLAIRAAVFHVAKVMLYLNAQDARTEPNKERSALLKQISGLKGGGKISKAQRKLHKAYDRIIVGAPNLPNIKHANGPVPTTHGQKSTHWRRGHFRNQAYGENWSKHRAIYIEPVLVQGILEESVAPHYKPYKIGTA